MKTTITKKIEVNIKSILIYITLRYISDGDKDDIQSDTPIPNGKNWTVNVDINTGQIKNWPIGRTSSFKAKVCDAGTYTLFDENDEVVLCIDSGYVPNGIVQSEFDNYIDLKINEQGIIENWLESLDVSDFFE